MDTRCGAVKQMARGKQWRFSAVVFVNQALSRIAEQTISRQRTRAAASRL
jgi:hypothetical protein